MHVRRHVLTPSPPSGEDREDNDPRALFSSCQTELRRIARSLLRKERPHHTLQATALVNEAFLRLFAGRRPDWPDATAMIVAVAREMRRTLVDHARRRAALKRGGSQAVPLTSTDEPWQFIDPVKLLALDQALERLAADDRRAAAVVEMRYVSGLSTSEIAALLDVTRRTVERDWRLARARLYGDLHGLDR